jgi:hypothetical protein
MNRYIERSIGLLGASVAIGLGGVACGNQRLENSSSTTAKVIQATKCKTINGETNIRLMGSYKVGIENAVNGGECVTIYNPKTLRSVGTLAHNGSFAIDCIDGPKPAAFYIETLAHVKGDIDLDRHLVNELDGNDYLGTNFQGYDIPVC